jgi:GH15 family glucan-1,4-alpha-glucosidase
VVTERLLADGPDLRPAYTVDGGRLPDQRTLPLPGYPGGQDRIGNRVNRQFQLDVFGEALLLLAAAGRRDRLDTDAERAIDIAAQAIAERWKEPDAGIWELDLQNWTTSRLICAAGLRAAARLDADRHADWSALADRIVAACPADGHWLRTPDDDRVDAALLLPALRGGVPADDPRTIATVRAVREKLSVDGYVYRFRHDQRPLAEAEGAFLLCGFWTAMAEEVIGDHAWALRRFERNRAACGPPGLYTEEYDVVQRQLRGNLPQAFVHGGLIEAATRLAAP